MLTPARTLRNKWNALGLVCTKTWRSILPLAAVPLQKAAFGRQKLPHPSPVHMPVLLPPTSLDGWAPEKPWGWQGKAHSQ